MYEAQRSEQSSIGASAIQNPYPPLIHSCFLARHPVQLPQMDSRALATGVTISLLLGRTRTIPLAIKNTCISMVTINKPQKQLI